MLVERVVLKDVLWTVFGVAVAMFGLSALLLGGVDASAWTFGGWMDLLRTLVTVGGFGLAVLAYREWRRPEIAKRRADNAEAIIKQVGKVADILVRTRKGPVVSERERRFITLKVKKQVLEDPAFAVEELDAMAEAASELGGYVEIAGVLYPGNERLMESLRWFLTIGEDTAMVLRGVRALRPKADSINEGHPLEHAYDAIFIAFGVQFLPEKDLVSGAHLAINFRKELVRHRRVVAEELGPFLYQRH